MSSRHRLKPVAPLKSALPDVFLRKNRFEERVLQNKRKVLEKAEKKVIDRLAREQEEFAILNCVCIGSDSDSFGNSSDTLRCTPKKIECDNDYVDHMLDNNDKSSVMKETVNGLAINENISENSNNACEMGDQRYPKSQSSPEVSRPVHNITLSKLNGNHLRRSKSAMNKTSIAENPPETKNIWSLRSDKNKLKTDEKRKFNKPPLRTTLSLPAGTGLGLTKGAEEISGGIKMRAKSAPVKHARAAFSGRDGRAMSLTPVVRHISLNDAYSNFKPQTTSKRLRDLPKTAQVQLKNSVYFLSQHKIKQQNEMTKIRTRRAISAQTTNYLYKS